jgi:hypothetical protein
MQTAVLVLAVAGAVVAQSTTSTAEPAATPMIVVGGQYANQKIAGQHVGAAQSYQVILSDRSGNTLGAAGDQYFFNETSNQLMDESLVADIPLPCYIVNDTTISNNSGPLECGALGDSYSRNTINLGDDGSVYFVGVQSLWVCGVNATQPYGVIAGTVVGGFTTSEPTGPGIHNCSAISGIKLASGGPTPSSSSSSSSTKTSSGSSTQSQTNTLTTDRMTTMASPTSTSILTGVEQSTSSSILTGVEQSTSTIITGVVQSTSAAASSTNPSSPATSTIAPATGGAAHDKMIGMSLIAGGLGLLFLVTL